MLKFKNLILKMASLSFIVMLVAISTPLKVLAGSKAVSSSEVDAPTDCFGGEDGPVK
jgi:hypothetical protein